ncbi:MAG: hypothetical protein EHM45_21515 [Desulfobacteraceae bacterium]|nr:MAG: hypothetical protein EHM45_21515 [Desulfobacteraceae bacterium]
MGFPDFFTIGNFKKSPQGHWLFFPYSTSGPGYVIDSERLYKKLRRQMTIILLVSLLFGILIIKIARMEHFIYYLLFIPLLFAQHFSIYRLYRHLTRTDEKMTWGHFFNNQYILWTYLITTVMVVVLLLLFLFRFPDTWMIAITGIIVFGSGAAFFIKRIIAKKRPKKI